MAHDDGSIERLVEEDSKPLLENNHVAILHNMIPIHFHIFLRDHIQYHFCAVIFRIIFAWLYSVSFIHDHIRINFHDCIRIIFIGHINYPV